ncbi:hypothetical protein M0R88_10450 [Halorussus gelatinilyticus]|uniref:Uncharacterized protein n=1 Tax=Halorussus gelatinilyticus TaxID=2937524 RepID=A0A8U0IFW4_9EURY|nr:hypothetical protein [Halorussus gelatinilyticus]UPV98948.1 hypothetical protein M0R88_10450 [Halorussus gelatinilyticus]
MFEAVDGVAVAFDHLADWDACDEQVRCVRFFGVVNTPELDLIECLFSLGELDFDCLAFLTFLLEVSFESVYLASFSSSAASRSLRRSVSCWT